MIYEPKKILSGIEKAINQEAPYHPQPMPGDKWLLSSAMQKAIRRGETERAISAAASLWQQDRQSFWRRLHIIALEDVGVGNPHVLVRVLAATASPIWRRHMGDLKTGLYFTRLLCESVKSRVADELFIQVERAKECDQLRERLAIAREEALTDYVINEEASLVERALSLWYLAGTKKFPSDVMPQRNGSPEEAIYVLSSLDVPDDLVESCIAVMGRTPWPLSIFMPLIWQETKKHGALHIRHDAIPVSADIEGLPLYAADVFTRVGQSCFRQLQRAVPELKKFSVKQIGLGIFYSEGGRVDKVLTSDFFDDFRQTGEIADIESAGLGRADYAELQQCLHSNMELLAEIRQEQLRRYWSSEAKK